jgi:hypothetical protein
MNKFIFIEGYYDELFFKKILNILKIDEKVELFQYSQKSDIKVNNYLSSLRSQSIQFLFVADDDGQNYSSTISRICKLKQRYPKLSEDEIVLVVPEIEGWYMAGLTTKNAKQIKLKDLPNPNECTKELFISKLPGRADGTSIRTMIMDNYNVELAKKNSPSFKNFIEKIQLW